MNIAYHSSDAYASMLGVSITSLFENNKRTDEINVYVIEKNISKGNKDLLVSLAEKYARKIFFIPMPDINKQEHLGLVKVKENWTFDSYCRIFLDKLLPEYIERVLYLDSDVIVVDDLEQLWDTDLKDCCAAGVLDCISERYYDVLGFDKQATYCNSGMILFNLKIWKSLHMDQAIKQYISARNGYVFYMEQTVLNAVMEGKWYIADAKYNVNTLMMSLSYKELQTLRKSKRFYSEDKIKEAVAHPIIIHMTNVFLINNRAWVEGSNHPALHYYEMYKSLSPWAAVPNLPDNRTFRNRLVGFFVRNIPNAILLPAVSYIYNYGRINIIRHEIERHQEKTVM